MNDPVCYSFQSPPFPHYITLLQVAVNVIAKLGIYFIARCGSYYKCDIYYEVRHSDTLPSDEVRHSDALPSQLRRNKNCQFLL